MTAGGSLTREHMNRLRVRRHDQVVAAEKNNNAEFCPIANAEVLMPPNGICLFCNTDHTLRSRLTNRQVESMRLLAAGSTRKQIAHVLDVSEATIANDWRDTRRALQAKTTAQAVVMLVREGSV